MATTKNTVKKPVWLKYSEQEVKEIILKIAEKDANHVLEISKSLALEGKIIGKVI